MHWLPGGRRLRIPMNVPRAWPGIGQGGDGRSVTPGSGVGTRRSAGEHPDRRRSCGEARCRDGGARGRRAASADLDGRWPRRRSSHAQGFGANRDRGRGAGHRRGRSRTPGCRGSRGRETSGEVGHCPADRRTCRARGTGVGQGGDGRSSRQVLESARADLQESVRIAAEAAARPAAETAARAVAEQLLQVSTCRCARRRSSHAQGFGASCDRGRGAGCARDRGAGHRRGRSRTPDCRGSRGRAASGEIGHCPADRRTCRAHWNRPGGDGGGVTRRSGVGQGGDGRSVTPGSGVGTRRSAGERPDRRRSCSEARCRDGGARCRRAASADLHLPLRAKTKLSCAGIWSKLRPRPRSGLRARPRSRSSARQKSHARLPRQPRTRSFRRNWPLSSRPPNVPREHWNRRAVMEGRHVLESAKAAIEEASRQVLESARADLQESARIAAEAAARPAAETAARAVAEQLLQVSLAAAREDEAASRRQLEERAIAVADRVGRELVKLAFDAATAKGQPAAGESEVSEGKTADQTAMTATATSERPVRHCVDRNAGASDLARRSNARCSLSVGEELLLACNFRVAAFLASTGLPTDDARRFLAASHSRASVFDFTKVLRHATSANWSRYAADCVTRPSTGRARYEV